MKKEKYAYSKGSLQIDPKGNSSLYYAGSQSRGGKFASLIDRQTKEIIRQQTPKKKQFPYKQQSPDLKGTNIHTKKHSTPPSEQQSLSQLNQISEMLKLIYTTLWDEDLYNRTIINYQKLQEQSLDDGEEQQFNIQGKLLQDIVEEVTRLKKQQQKSSFSKKKTKNQQPQSSPYKNINKDNSLKKYYTNHYLSNMGIVKEDHHLGMFKKHSQKINSLYNDANLFQQKVNQPTLEIRQLRQMVQSKNSQIKKLQNKIKKLEQKVHSLQNQLKQALDQSSNLHRLNESKFTQINELKRQLNEQQSFIDQQCTVIQQLQKTLNHSVMLNQSQPLPDDSIKQRDNQNNINIEENVLDDLQDYDDGTLGDDERRRLQTKGKVKAWEELIEEIDIEIKNIQLSHSNGPSIYSQNNNIAANHQVDDGIEQLELSFRDTIQTTSQHHLASLNTFEYQRQPSPPLTNHQSNHTHILQDEHQGEISTIYHPFEEPSFIHNNNNFTLEQQIQSFSKHNITHTSNYFQNSIEELSFLTDKKYLSTIETMTQQLTSAYQTINLLHQKIAQINIQHQNHTKIINNHSKINQNQHHKKASTHHDHILSPVFNQQPHIEPNPETIKPKDKPKTHNKSFKFNLSFWK